MENAKEGSHIRPQSIKVREISPYLIEIRHICTQTPVKVRHLLASDLHFDNPKCNREMLFKHFDQCRDAGGKILLNGDTFCLMEGKGDRRHSKSNIRPEYNKSNYIDLVIEDAAAKFAEYGDMFALLGDGNHETAIKRHLETDPTSRLEGLLKHKYGLKNTCRQGYHGFVRFVFCVIPHGSVRSVTLYRHHGKWGGPVTKGVISSARLSAIVPDADIVWRGHNHEAWNLEVQRYKIKQNGDMVYATQHHINTPTYKDEFITTGGFAIEKIAVPKPLGAHWLDLTYSQKGVEVSFSRAQ